MTRPPISYTGKLADFERQVLDHADHYTVYRRTGRGERTVERFEDLAAARARAAELGPRAMIYAVRGVHSVLVPEEGT